MSHDGFVGLTMAVQEAGMQDTPARNYACLQAAAKSPVLSPGRPRTTLNQEHRPCQVQRCLGAPYVPVQL